MSLPNATKPLLLASPAAAGYQVSRSLRFNSADSAYLTRTPAAGDATKWTWSGWVKRSRLSSAYEVLFSGRVTGGYYTQSVLLFDPSDRLWYYQFSNASGYTVTVTSTEVFRDPCAWLHVVLKFDAAATSLQAWVNNSLVINSSSFSTTYRLINTATQHLLGAYGDNSNIYSASQMMAETHFIDGQALTPSSFAETNATTGQWVPKAYAGTYGTNGFKLNFSDNSAATAATLGADSSGNGNNFTPTNLSVTAGVNNDSLTDTPTQYGSDTGAGGEVRGNYCTLNPAIPSASGITNGNLDDTGAAQGTFDITSGSWYWESTASATAAGGIINSAGTAYTTAIASGVTRGFRYASSTTTLESTINGSSWTTISAAVVGQPFPYVLTGATSSNFGQRAFAYTAPSGYKALCVQNLSTPTIVLPSTAFDAKLYTGTGSSQSITGLGFNPDLVWIKSRSAATDNTLYDSVRGAQARLESNNTDAEVTADNGLTAFDATGFTVNTLAQVNTSAATYVGWCWDKSVSAGFDIVSYTGNGANRTVAHSLGVAPKVMIVKRRGNVDAWPVYHANLTSAAYALSLNTTAAQASVPTYWNSTAPTSSVFSLGTSTVVNATSSTYIAYLWAEVAGFSKFGSYTGNGVVDGPFVHCGFRPKFLMIKIQSGYAVNWYIHDSARSPNNASTLFLLSSLAYAETTDGDGLDILSNGFKLRCIHGDGGINYTSTPCIFMAFAENPFKYANAK